MFDSSYGDRDTHSRSRAEKARAFPRDASTDECTLSLHASRGQTESMDYDDTIHMIHKASRKTGGN